MRKLLLIILFFGLLSSIGFCQGRYLIGTNIIVKSDTRKNTFWNATDSMNMWNDGLYWNFDFTKNKRFVFHDTVKANQGIMFSDLSILKTASDTGKLNTTGTDIKYGNITMADSVYLSNTTINTLLGTTGTKAIKSFSTVDLTSTGIALTTDTTWVKTTGDTINGNLSFKGDNRSILNISNKALIFGANNSEGFRLTENKKILVNCTTERTVGGSSCAIQLEGIATGVQTNFGFIKNSNDAYANVFAFAKSRGATLNSNTIVQDGDALGNIAFCGSDGVNLTSYGALITANVDGVPNIGDMPARLVFSTTPDGAAVATEKMRITNGGLILIGNTTGTLNLSLNGNASQTLGIIRHTTANTAGVNATWYINGGCTSGSSSKGSGLGVITNNITTGAGKGSIKLLMPDRLPYGTAASTTDNTLREKFFYASSKPLRKAINDTLFSVVIGADSTFTATIGYGINMYNSDSIGVENGTIKVRCVGLASTSVEVTTLLEQKFKIAGTTLTATFSIGRDVANRRVFLIVNPTSNTAITYVAGLGNFSELNIDYTGLQMSGRFTGFTTY